MEYGSQDLTDKANCIPFNCLWRTSFGANSVHWKKLDPFLMRSLLRGRADQDKYRQSVPTNCHRRPCHDPLSKVKIEDLLGLYTDCSSVPCTSAYGFANYSQELVRLVIPVLKY